uniref:Uncharacterized protein n=1 Tax=Arundo donax TaxID=35708 RepID=A0A0A9DGF8_ARUDO
MASKELQDVPIGFKSLSSIKEAYFTRMHSDFVRNLKMGKLNHIPKVYWSTQGVLTDETEPANLPKPCSTNPQWHILGGSGRVFI